MYMLEKLYKCIGNQCGIEALYQARDFPNSDDTKMGKKIPNLLSSPYPISIFQ